MANILVIDVGSHKAEEVMLFEGNPSWSLRNKLRMLRRHKFSGLRQITNINRRSKEFASNHEFRYVLIEPIMHRELLDFVARKSSLLIGGVSSCGDSGPIDLLMAADSLGHSLIPSKPNLSGRKMPVYNLNFIALYEFLVETFIASGDCGGVVVRMNAEGVEGPIVDYLSQHANPKPLALAGSLGDIKKCFGEQAYDSAMRTLNDAEIPFIYLTSHPRSWSSGLEQLEKVLMGRS